MQQPNWLDSMYDGVLATSTPAQALAILSNDSRIVKAVADAMAAFDARKPGVMGDSRTQVIRKALADTLQAMV